VLIRGWITQGSDVAAIHQLIGTTPAVFFVFDILLLLAVGFEGNSAD
jgi:hypothetical protein